MAEDPSNATVLLAALSAAPDGRVMDRVFPLVYSELRRLAEQHFSSESPGHTLQPTALVHETWIRLMRQSGQQWSSPAYFFAAAAEAMRRILIEHARRKNRPIHGAGRARVPLEALDAWAADHADWPVFDEALTALAQCDARAAEVVKLRIYAGLSVEHTADLLGISASTAKREWAYARAWLRERLDA